MSTLFDPMDARAEVLDGLRNLIDHLQRHPDLIPIPGCRVGIAAPNVREYLQLVHALGGHTRRHESSMFSGVERDFGGGVVLDVYISTYAAEQSA